MIVELDFINHKCIVTKEKGDPRFRATNWGLAESTFLYHVLQEIKKDGYDVIKKRMWKDGHMVDDTMQYIRTRNWGSGNGFCIYNTNYALWDAGEIFNRDGIVELKIEWECSA